jgi:hypothetical protein
MENPADKAGKRAKPERGRPKGTKNTKKGARAK